MIQLGTFGRADDLGVSIGGSLTQDRSRVHRTVAATTAPDATRVIVDDGDDALELTDIGLHPDQRNRLFAGGGAGPNGALTVTAYREDGSQIAQRQLHDR